MYTNTADRTITYYIHWLGCSTTKFLAIIFRIQLAKPYGSCLDACLIHDRSVRVRIAEQIKLDFEEHEEFFGYNRATWVRQSAVKELGTNVIDVIC